MPTTHLSTLCGPKHMLKPGDNVIAFCLLDYSKIFSFPFSPIYLEEKKYQLFITLSTQLHELAFWSSTYFLRTYSIIIFKNNFLMRTHLVILRGLKFSDIVTLNNIRWIFRITPKKTRLNALVVVEWGSWGGAAEILPSCKLSFSNNGETCAPRKCNACCRSKDYREGIGGG